MTRTDISDTIKEQVERMPTNPGVYLFKDKAGKIIYVGKAKELRTRVRSYLREGSDGRHHIQFLVQRADSVDYIVTDTEQEAFLLENNLIKKHRPRYNIFLKDDKTYVHLRLNINHPFPRLTVVRRPKRDGARYFGPFASAGSVRQTLRTLGRIFPMRTCTDRELESRQRPCLYYYIKRCSAPCMGYVDAQEYADVVNKVTMFLKGRGNELLKSLRDKMELQAAERKYEQAARTRDQVFAIQSVLEKQKVSSQLKSEMDVFAAARSKEQLVIARLSVRAGEFIGGESHHHEHAVLSTGEHLASFINQYYQAGAAIPKKVIAPADLDEADATALGEFLSTRRKKRCEVVRPQRGEGARVLKLAEKNARIALEESGVSERNRALLEDLEELLSLGRYPRRIECYDISNIQGSDPVASGVTFIDGEPSKSHYRKYKIRTIKGADDYGMMREVLERRISRGLKEGDLPDLLVIDGGRGQLGVALEVLDRLGCDDVDAVGIAKVRDEKTGRKVRGKERIYTTGLDEPLLLEGTSPALFLLERIRDEAHRFAITYHKTLRGKRAGASALDAIPGVGPVLKRRLLNEFGSVARIRRAPLEALASVPGMSPRLAQVVKDALT